MLQGSRITGTAKVGSEKLKKTAATPYHAEKVKGEAHEGERFGDTAFIVSMPTFFPHNKPYGHIFQSKNNDCVITILANHKFGLCYGMPPRLIFASIINEVHETKSPVLNIGTIYSKLLSNLNVSQYENSPMNRKSLYDQLLRFFSSYISCSYKKQGNEFCSFDFWRIPLKGRKESISSNATIVLTKDFYNELINFLALVDFKNPVLKPYQLNIVINDLIEERLI